MKSVSHDRRMTVLGAEEAASVRIFILGEGNLATLILTKNAGRFSDMGYDICKLVFVVLAVQVLS